MKEEKRERNSPQLPVLQIQQVVSYQMYIHVRALHIFLDPPNSFGKTGSLKVTGSLTSFTQMQMTPKYQFMRGHGLSNFHVYL